MEEKIIYALSVVAAHYYNRNHEVCTVTNGYPSQLPKRSAQPPHNFVLTANKLPEDSQQVGKDFES